MALKTSYELWPLNGQLRRMGAVELSATLAGADPMGSLSKGIPVFVEAVNVRQLLESMHLDGRKADDIERVVTAAIDAVGVWKGEAAAIYRRVST